MLATSDDPTRARPRHALLLSAAAGFVDALGYFDLGQVFTANMTGNTVLLFAALGRADWPQSLAYCAAVAAFTLGAVAGSLLKRWSGRAAVPLFVVAAIIAGFEFVALDRVAAIAALSFAMGVQGASVSRFDGIGLQTVVLTGGLVRISEGLVERTFGPGTGDKGRSSTIRLLGLAWLAYGLGAAGAAVAPGWTELPLLVPAAAVLVAAVDLMRASAGRS